MSSPGTTDGYAAASTLPPPFESEVQRVAGTAAMGVPGVVALGTDTRRRLASGFGRISGGRTVLGAGVNADISATQAAVDLALVLDFGTAIPEVSRQVREAVAAAVTARTGLEVTEVNVDVLDLELPPELAPVEPAVEPAPELDEPAVAVVPEATVAPVVPEAPATGIDEVDDAVVADLVERISRTPQVEAPVAVTKTTVTTTVIEPDGSGNPASVGEPGPTDEESR